MEGNNIITNRQITLPSSLSSINIRMILATWHDQHPRSETEYFQPLHSVVSILLSYIPVSYNTTGISGTVPSLVPPSSQTWSVRPRQDFPAPGSTKEQNPIPPRELAR
jgi:hypothetical protein